MRRARYTPPINGTDVLLAGDPIYAVDGRSTVFRSLQSG